MTSVSFAWPGVLALAALGSTVDAQEARRLDPVVVSGTRQSLESAQARKRDADGVLDAVVAEDIHRLPDPNVADALQRVTGVQVGRDRGEGSTVAVRGLIQVETTVNGREVFTAGTGRTLDFADVAAEMLAGIDVHKSSAADRIEGGLGGSIDLRTHRPFGFRADTTALTARAVHGELSHGVAGQASGLVVRRRRIGDGEIGLLLNVVHQERRWREDQKTTGAPTRCGPDQPLPASNCTVELVPGQLVFAPASTSESSSVGRRRRTGGSVIVEWRPTPAWQAYGEAHLAEFVTLQETNQINASYPINPPFGTGVVPGSVALFPGTSDVQRVTWTNAPLSILNFARDTRDRTAQFALGGRWRGERTEVEADASHTKSRNHLYFAGPIFGATAPLFTHDLGGTVPATSVGGIDLGDPTQIRYTGYAYRTRPFEGQLNAVRVDARRELEAGPIDEVAAGWRHARREADNLPGLVFGDAGLSGLTMADTPGRIAPNPVGNFLDGRAPSLGGYLVGSLADARDAVAARAALGLTAPLPTAAGPTTLWRIRERTDALYGQAHARWPALQLDGQAGVRVVRTQRVTDSAQRTGSGAIEPIALDDTQTDTLPSASLRWRPAPGVQARLALSRTLTRPDFTQLSPALILTPNPINPTLNQGAAGNPALRPIRADNLDLAFERDFGRGHALALALFRKNVDGFIATTGADEEHGGQVYRVNRPRNLDPGRVQGVELAWQRFFDGLPGAWRGLGVQANYTYVDSEVFDRTLLRQTPLPNLSRHSANLVGLYELGPWSARLAWNWRSRYYGGAQSVVGTGTLETWTAAHGWVDASLRWRINGRLTWSLDGVNLTRTLRRSDFGAPTRPWTAWVNERQLATSLGVQF